MTESLPLVSVILPTHNRAELLRRSLDSVLAQSYRNLEVLVVENACSDHTATVLDRYTDPRLRRLRIDARVNASTARNRALRVAQGRLIAFQDDDDLWLHDKLERQVASLLAAGPATVLNLCGHLRLLPGREQPCCSTRDFEQLRFDLGLSHSQPVIATPAWLVHRHALEQVGGFDEALPARNDWELALRLHDLGPFTFLAEPLFIQDQRLPTSMAHNQTAHGAALRRIEAVHGHRWAGAPAVRAAHARAIAKAALLSGDGREARRWLRRALGLQPLRLRTWGAYLSALLPTRLVPGLLAIYHRLYVRTVGKAS